MPSSCAVSGPERLESPPEGARCALHPERQALVVCPRCGKNSCLTCWHGSLRLCHACVTRDPAPSAPWTDPKLSWPSRFFRTFAAAFRPQAHARSLASGPTPPALIFAFVSALPLAALSGVIPFTHTLRFGNYFSTSIIGSPTSHQMTLDIAQAVGFGILLTVTKVAVLALPYWSLCRAYGTEAKRVGESDAAVDSAAPLRAVFYRAWLIPLAGLYGLVWGVALWGSPAEPSATLAILERIVPIIPLLFIFSGLMASGRVASGLGPVGATVAVVVPFALLILAEFMVIQLLEPWLPAGLAPDLSADPAAGAAGGST